MSEPVSLVIGGTSGIGRAVALRFAAEGHRVLVAGRDAARGAAVAQDCTAAGASAAAFLPVDVADPASMEALGVAVQDGFGTPEIVVNCAGILQSGKRVLDQPLEEDEQLWRINYRGTLLGCQVFGRLMAAAGRGAILNVGSLASFAPLSLPAYTPGKHAVLALTQILANELGPKGIRVHAISPGPLKTRAASGINDFDEMLERAQSTAPARSLVSIEDVGLATAYLATDAAKLVTGQTLYIDGGYNIMG